LILRTVFILVASLGILAALGTVLARNLVHAALFLVAFFFTIACQFVLLEAEFLAAIQVLVYIGAVAVLLLFGIMLTRNIQGDETTGGRALARIPGAIVALAVLAVLIAGIRGETSPAGGLRDKGSPSWTARTTRPPADAPGDPRGPIINQMAPAIGVELMTRYALVFEVAGLLLTAAVVGSIALAHGERDESAGTRPRRLARPAAGPIGPGDGASLVPTRSAPAPAPSASAPR
jgi:NADH-quinone oxidoreductase subunit J